MSIYFSVGLIVFVYLCPFFYLSITAFLWTSCSCLLLVRTFVTINNIGVSDFLLDFGAISVKPSKIRLIAYSLPCKDDIKGKMSNRFNLYFSSPCLHPICKFSSF